MILKLPTQLVLAMSVVSVCFANDKADEPMCANIVNNAARLACFDEWASGTIRQNKQAIMLGDTLIHTFRGTPKIVLADSVATNFTPAHLTKKWDNNSNNSNNSNSNDNSDHNNSDNHFDDSNKNASHNNSYDKSTDKQQVNYSDQLQMADNWSSVLTEIGVSDGALARYTPLSLTFDLESNSERGLWSARPHNANYILPLYVNNRPNRYPNTPNQTIKAFSADQMNKAELKFQLSLKTKAAQNLFGTDADLWLGYTQISHWQVYNGDYSRPFRGHDYEPEIFLTQPVGGTLPFGGRLRVLGVGAAHHSNGESDPLSRSWNRVYLLGGAEWGKLTIMPRVWGRLPKLNTKRPDDNPDITRYYGYGDVKFLYRLDRGNTLSGLVRYNPISQKGALQIDYVHPITQGVSGYVQLFHGYGQSIVDYNHNAGSVGFGIMLNDWMGL